MREVEKGLFVTFVLMYQEGEGGDQFKEFEYWEQATDYIRDHLNVGSVDNFKILQYDYVEDKEQLSVKDILPEIMEVYGKYLF